MMWTWSMHRVTARLIQRSLARPFANTVAHMSSSSVPSSHMLCADGTPLVLYGTRRTELKKHIVGKLREEGKLPASLSGDRLPEVSLTLDAKAASAAARRGNLRQRLVTLQIDEEEPIQALAREIQGAPMNDVTPLHITFVRWPRNPKKNPLRMWIPFEIINESKHPSVKAGAYVMEYFQLYQGLEVRATSPDFPEKIIADFSKAQETDLRRNDVDIPSVFKVAFKKVIQEGNFLIARAKRIRG